MNFWEGIIIILKISDFFSHASLNLTWFSFSIFISYVKFMDMEIQFTEIYSCLSDWWCLWVSEQKLFLTYSCVSFFLILKLKCMWKAIKWIFIKKSSKHNNFQFIFIAFRESHARLWEMWIIFTNNSFHLRSFGMCGFAWFRSISRMNLNWMELMILNK